MKDNVKLNYLSGFNTYSSDHRPTVYMVVDGLLTEAELVKISYTLITSDTAEAKATVLFPDGRRKLLPVWDWCKLFASIEDFEVGKPLNVDVKYFCNIRSYRNSKGVQPDKGQLRWWYMKDGEPKEQVIDIDELTLSYYVTPGWELPDDCVPHSRPYDTREECLSFNKYTSVDKEGNETTHVGKNMLVQLDDDQRGLIDDLCDTLKELEKAGIILVVDTMEGVQAFNARNIKNWDFGYDRSCIDDEDREKYEEINRYAPEFSTKIPVSVWADDCTLWIKRKDSKEE